MRAALVEQLARRVEVAEAEVNLADARERGALQRTVVLAPAFVEYARIGVEGHGEVALRGERPAEPFERSRFSPFVQCLEEQRAAPAIVGDRAGEVSLDELHVPDAYERQRNGGHIVPALMNRKHLPV